MLHVFGSQIGSGADGRRTSRSSSGVSFRAKAASNSAASDAFLAPGHRNFNVHRQLVYVR